MLFLNGLFRIDILNVSDFISFSNLLQHHLLQNGDTPIPLWRLNIKKTEIGRFGLFWDLK